LEYFGLFRGFLILMCLFHDSSQISERRSSETWGNTDLDREVCWIHKRDFSNTSCHRQQFMAFSAI
jgi:hypothetical protein